MLPFFLTVFQVLEFHLSWNTCHVAQKGFGLISQGFRWGWTPPQFFPLPNFTCSPPRDRKCRTQEVACCLNGSVCPPSRRPSSPGRSSGDQPGRPKLLFSCLPSPWIKWLSLASSSLACLPSSTGVALRFTSHLRPWGDEAAGCFILFGCFFFPPVFLLAHLEGANDWCVFN